MSDLMTAAVYIGPMDVRVDERPVPHPGEGQLLLKVLACGVCGTDVHAYQFGHQLMRPMTVPGHELAGTVVEAGRGTTMPVGTTVACGATLACGDCTSCRRGRPNLCLSYGAVGLSADGGMAQFCVVPERICLDIAPFGLTPDTAALAQPASVAVHAAKRGQPTPEQNIAVFGAGGIGALVVAALSSFSLAPTVYDPSPAQLDLVGKLAPSAVASREAPQEPASFDLVYEASGTPGGLAQALGSLRRGGRLVMIGLQPGESQIDTRPLVLREYEIRGSQSHVVEQDMANAMTMLARVGRDAWDAYAPNVLPLDELVSGVLHPRPDGPVLPGGKVLFDPWAPVRRATDHSPGPLARSGRSS